MGSPKSARGIRRSQALPNAITFKRGGATVVIKRDAQTGRFATKKSAKTIDRAAARFAPALDRLAKR